MGGLLPGREDRGALVKQGKRLAHKYSGIKSSKICNLNIHPERELPQQHTHSNGQHDSSMLFSQNGGNKQSGASEIKQTNLEPFDFIGDHSYCRTSPRDSKYRSGLRVKECEGLQRVEARQQDFSKTLQEIRVPKDRSICLKSIQTAKEILFLENRPFQCRQGCVSSKLVPGSKLCLSPIQSDRTSTSKGPERKVNTNSYNAGMADSVLVSKSNGNGYINTSSSPCYENLLSNPKKEIHPLLLNQSLRLLAWKVSGKSYLQKEFQRGLPISSPTQEEWEQTLITNRPGESSIVGVMGNKLIPLHAMYP